MHFLGRIGIDYKILIAQIVNFIVLLFFLQHLLYKPLIKRIEERKRKIKEIEEKAKELRRKEEEVQRRAEEIIEEAKRKTREIIEEGKEVSEEEKERILKRAEEEMRKILREARERARIEVEKMKLQEKEKILEVAKKVVEDVFSKSFSRELHRLYLEETIQDLKKINFNKVKQGKEVIQITITSAFPLSKKQIKEISDFLFKKLGSSIFQEKIDPGLLAGMKIQIDGFLIDGSLKTKIEKLI